MLTTLYVFLATSDTATSVATRGFDAMDSMRKVERPAGPYVKRVEFESVTPQALVLAGYVGCDQKNKDDRRRLAIAQVPD